jgi:hypothetical protein
MTQNLAKFSKLLTNIKLATAVVTVYYLSK